MRIKQDIKEFINNKLERTVKSHIEAWYAHYAGMSKKEASYELDINYDWKTEFEYIEQEIGRGLLPYEESYIFKKYIKLFKANYYESMQEGYKIQSGYYLTR